jgi:hypothetical protein
MPVRKPEDYDEDWDKHTRWLSRRWLCNVPRSHRTEGLRPIGRLAMVDHAQEVRERLRAVLVVQTQVELVPAGTLQRSEYKSKLIER